MDYKKILEDVVDIINTTEKSDIGFANICTYIGENCPGLKESEDEKIKKRIIALVNAHGQGRYKDKMLSWFEKQGEQKPQGKSALEAIKEEKVDNANKDEPRQEELTEFERAVKQVLEEAIECGNTSNLKADADMLLSLVHNSSWSEEDEEMLNSFLHKLEVCDLLSIKEGIWIKNKLKSLKNRVHPQNTWARVISS